ncbi:MAG TPA: ELWxxDGT repeat protein [Steroidobacteraceae bacterium]|jgi:ELWxxDGT repeat protein|nr:ELWxxDGT repeat protein [Steroidobacteraceae bacterium]
MKHFGRASATALFASMIAMVFLTSIRGDAAELVKTIKSGAPGLVTWSGYEDMIAGVELPAGLLVSQKDPAHGTELWFTDGTPSGTRLIRDINPGTESSGPISFRRIGDVAVFQANDGIHGPELWRSDGTEAGTYLLADIGPGKQGFGSAPVFPGVVLNGILYFEADDGVSGSELWRTDGTREGTFLAADIVPGYAGSGPADLTVAGNRLYFRESDGLWVSDGTGAGTQKIADVVVLQCCVAAGDAVFFSANDGVHGGELWRAVGQTAAMVANLNTEPVGGGQDGSSEPAFVTARGDSVIFIAQTRNTAPGATTAYDCKLYRANASGGGATELVNFHDHCSLRKPINLPGGMMFSLPTFGPPSPGQRDELWVTDGTPAGTMPLDLNGLHYSTVLLDEVHFMPAYGPNGEAYFFGTQGAGQPDKIWRTDGTRAGTHVFADLATNSSMQEVAWFNGRVYFDVGGNTPVPQTGLWTSDGTLAGTTTVRIGDISSISDLRVAHGRLLFWSATADPTQRELWASDGTSNGTIYLGKRSAAADNASVDANVVFAGQLGSRAVFAAQLDSVALNRELSITDGTGINTSLVRDINIGGSSDPGNFLTLGNQILFVAHDFDHAQELWRTDGTGSGTFQLQDIVRQGSDAHVTLGGPDTIINGVAYFTAGESGMNPDLWRTDGTVAGTSQITIVSALRFYILGSNGSNLLFRASSPGGGTHLWSWNGSQAQIITAADGLKITSDPGARFGARVCFRAWDVDPRYIDVWCASGAQGDLVRATNLAALSLSAGEMHALGNKLLVNVPGSGAASGLYFTQGTATTAQRISGERIKTATAFGNGQLLFLSESGNLMLTDGTSAGTRNLLQGVTLPGPISGAFGVLGTYVVFVVNDPSRGAVVWRTDGSAVGARYVTDLDPATTPASAQEASFFTLGNRLLYSGYRTNIGNDVWALNATDPNATNDTLAATAGTPVSAPLLDNDADFDGTLNVGSVSIVTQPAHGTAVVSASTGAITYTANSTYSGPDELTYRVSDNQGNASNAATLSIQVTGGVSNPPSPPPSPPSGGGGGGALGLEVLALMLLAVLRAASIQLRLIGRTGWNSCRENARMTGWKTSLLY